MLEFRHHPGAYAQQRKAGQQGEFYPHGPRTFATAVHKIIVPVFPAVAIAAHLQSAASRPPLSQAGLYTASPFRSISHATFFSPA